VMQHLIVHLPWEALVGGPVQFRWMYPIERALKKLRASVRKKGVLRRLLPLRRYLNSQPGISLEPTMCLLLQCDFMSKMNRPKLSEVG
jgi:hypothetical protein